MSNPVIHVHKDPSLKTLLIQEALKSRGLYTGDCDNWHGPRTEDAYQDFYAGLQPVLAGDNLHRDISAEGLDLIKHFEGLFLTAYKDPVGIWTIGWGHTGLKHQDGTVYAGRKVTTAEAEDLLKYDLTSFAKRVQGGTIVPLTDDQFSALVSFDFNTGGFLSSTLRKKLNAGDYNGAADEFLRWDKAGGKTLPGLTRRRKSERNLFLGISPAIVR